VELHHSDFGAKFTDVKVTITLLKVQLKLEKRRLHLKWKRGEKV
jgi:hypothetical protein